MRPTLTIRYPNDNPPLKGRWEPRRFLIGKCASQRAVGFTPHEMPKTKPPRKYAP